MAQTTSKMVVLGVVCVFPSFLFSYSTSFIFLSCFYLRITFFYPCTYDLFLPLLLFCFVHFKVSRDIFYYLFIVIMYFVHRSVNPSDTKTNKVWVTLKSGKFHFGSVLYSRGYKGGPSILDDNYR